METIPSVKQRDWSWVWTQVVTYVRLREDADVKAFQEKAATFAEKVIKPAVEARGGNFNESVKQGNGFLSRPMRDIHLRSGDNRMSPVGNYRYVYTFAAAGVFVLLIAAINFINLSTARATKRAKEVGVKKTLGAIRNSLVYQFQFESIMLTSIATTLSVLLAESLRILIARIAGIEIAFSLFNDITLLSIIPLLPIVDWILAGLYPSPLYLTAFRPAHVLKGRIASGMGNLGLRNVLVIAQFTISIALIAGTMIVFQQLRYVSSADLGFDKENVLLIKYAEKLGTHLEAFRDEIETYPGVTNVGITMEPPGGGFVGRRHDT